MTQDKIKKEKKYATSNILLIILLFISSLINGYMYFQLKEYGVLKNSYVLLYNRTEVLEDYYDELNSMYSDVREEYDQLLKIHKDLLQRHSNLTKEYDDVFDYNKEIILASSQSVVIPIKTNASYIYELPFSGYIMMNFTANDDIYVWVGSSLMEGRYYSRYPQFPETTEAASFQVPVAPDLLLYIGNPNEFNEVSVEFTIKFVY